MTEHPSNLHTKLTKAEIILYTESDNQINKAKNRKLAFAQR